jgi:uncharacterized protein
MSQTILTNPSQDEINLAVMMHIGGIFFKFIPSLIVYLVLSEGKPWLKEEAKEALNFELTFVIYYFIAGILVFVLIGIVLLPIIFVIEVILTVTGILSIYGGKKVHFPFIFRFLR